jgi:ADP-heptose:LPS heptosyltransferase
LPGVDDVVELCCPWIDPEPPPVRPAIIHALIDKLHARRVDAAIVLTSFHQSPLPTALMLRMAGVPFIAAISEDYPGSLLDIRHHVDDDLHEVQRALSLVARAGYPLPSGDDGRLTVRAADPPMIDAERGYVVVHPGASVPARAWSPQAFQELVTALNEDGWRVVVTGAPSERRLTRMVAGPPRPGVFDLGGRTSFAELAGLCARAAVTVVGNTGPAHLAAAAGSPVVSLFAATVPVERWRPWGVPHVVLGDLQLPCAGCRTRVCPQPGHPCLSAVEVGDVMAAVQQLAPLGVRL